MMLNFQLTYLVLFFLVVGCSSSSSNKNIKEPVINVKSQNVLSQKTSNSDTLPVKKFISRTVNGKQIEIPLTGETDFVVDEFINPHTQQQTRLKVIEIRPGVLLFQKYHRDTLYDPHYDEYYPRKKPVDDRIEFFDSYYNLISSYDMDSNNPYLNPKSMVKVREYFSDLEHYPHYTYGDWKEGEKIVEHHLQTAFCEESLVVSYSKKEISNKGRTRRDVTTLNFLNNQGEVIFTIESDDNPRCPAVDTTYTYAIITYHPFSGPNRTEGKSRFEIWDIGKNKLIHLEKLKMREFLNGTSLYENNVMHVSISYPNKGNGEGMRYLFIPNQSKLLGVEWDNDRRKEIIELYQKEKIHYNIDSIIHNINRFNPAKITLNNGK